MRWLYPKRTSDAIKLREIALLAHSGHRLSYHWNIFGQRPTQAKGHPASIFRPLKRLVNTMHSRLRAATHSPIFWLVTSVGLAAIGSNLTAGDGTGQEAGQQQVDLAREPVRLLREGARIESKMMVVRSGSENLSFETEDEKQSLEALENLALERVMQAVRADASDKRWLVTGQVTEYRGRNYILLERVSRAPRAAQ